MPRSKSRAVGGTHRGTPRTAAKPPAAVLRAVLRLREFIEGGDNWVSLRRGHAKLHDLLAALRKQQASCGYYRSIVPARCADSFEKLQQWLVDNGVCDGQGGAPPFQVRFREGGEADATLVATRKLKKGEVFVRVPRRAMLSAEVGQSPLKEMVDRVPALREFPSLLLALQLIAEAADGRSRFRAYIEALPSRFDTPFFGWSVEEIEGLWPSGAGGGVMRALKAQIRDYTYVYEACHKMKGGKGLDVAVMGVGNFMWALSVVMTRQNALRSGEGSVLVPGWDMCNHERGAMETNVLVAGGQVCVESEAMKDLDVGEEVKICYGERGNVQMLLYSGFVEVGNPWDSLTVVMRMLGGELEGFKAKMVLGRVGVDVRKVGGGWEVAGAVDWQKGCVEKLVGIARVIVAEKEGVAGMLKNGKGLPMEKIQGIDEGKARGLVREALEEMLSEYPAASIGSGMVEAEEHGYGDGDGDGNGDGSGNAIELVRQLHVEEIKLIRHALDSVGN